MESLDVSKSQTEKSYQNPSFSTDNPLPIRIPNCGRCRNHGLEVALKGHKRYCKYKNCGCEKCGLNIERQRLMGMQTALRRAEFHDEARSISVSEPVPSTSIPKPVTITSEHESSRYEYFNQTPNPNDYIFKRPLPPLPDPRLAEFLANSYYFPISSPMAAPIVTPTGLFPPPIRPFDPSLPMPFGHNRRPEIMLAYCRKLLDKFKYPAEMMPLIYVILEDANIDIEEASRRIEEGQVVVGNFCRKNNLNFYDAGALRG